MRPGRGTAPNRRRSLGVLHTWIEHERCRSDQRSTGMKSLPEVQVETRPSGGSSGGGGEDKVWTITGRLLVRESEIDGDAHDRPLKGVEVKVSASDLGADGPWTEWGTVRTDADGDFSLAESNNGRTRFFRVQARLNSSDLEVDDGTLEDVRSIDLVDRNWRIIWKSGVQLDGPAVSVGTRVIASGQSFDLGDPIFRRAALVWYVLRSAVDRLVSEDAWFAITPEVRVIYPARSVSQTSYNGSGGRIYLHEGEAGSWHPDVVLYRFMLQWHDHHTHGSRKASGFPSAFFAFGFSRFAANALMHELWGTRLELPLNRRAVAEGLALSTLDEIERSEPGVQNALRLLHCHQRQGWWNHLFGTALAYPEGRPDDDGDGMPDHPGEVGVKHRLDRRQVPAGPHHLSLRDILRTFRANPGKGWDTDLEVGNPNNSVLRFVDRAVDIHDLGEDVRLMLRRCIDPLAVGEPYESLPTVSLI
jgi:hypothetical protein